MAISITPIDLLGGFDSDNPNTNLVGNIKVDLKPWLQVLNGKQQVVLLDPLGSPVSSPLFVEFANGVGVIPFFVDTAPLPTGLQQIYSFKVGGRIFSLKIPKRPEFSAIPNPLITSPATIFIADATSAVVTLASALTANQVAPGTYTGNVRISFTDTNAEPQTILVRVPGVVPPVGGTFDFPLGDLSYLFDIATNVTMDAYLAADNTPTGTQLGVIGITAAVTLVLG